MKTLNMNQEIISALGVEVACLTPDSPNEGDAGCPLRDVLDRIGSKWSVLVVVLLKDSKLRFSDLRRSIEGISQRMLTQTLRQLERDGLVDRAVYPSVPMRVEYELTALGKTLIEPLAALADWAERHRGKILSARAAYDSRDEVAPRTDAGLDSLVLDSLVLDSLVLDSLVLDSLVPATHEVLP